MIYYILTRNGCFVLFTLTLYVLQCGYDIPSEICYIHMSKNSPTRLLISVSAIFLFYLNLQLLDNVIIIKT